MSKQILATDMKLLIRDINDKLEKNKNSSNQEEQVEKLLMLEKKIQKEMWKYPKLAREIYKSFVLKILVENGNILTARPYFRERSTVFASKITPALRTGDIDSLKKFHVNYNLLKFIKENWRGICPFEDVYNEFVETRQKLIENNLPLALNRAKIFFRKSRNDQFTLNDFIGFGVEGLISGIDKYTGKYAKVWVSVCIGRMVGFFTENSSQTQIYFYPSDRQILYRARSLGYKHKIEDLKTLTKVVNDSLTEDKKEGKKVYKTHVTEGDLANILTATNIMSTDAIVSKEENESARNTKGMDIIMPEEDDFKKIERNQALETVLKHVSELEMIPKKIIKLKGVSF
jgi:DNA-directed RNA polymerase specialized sigma subunit